jgi:hypothetical protein
VNVVGRRDLLVPFFFVAAVEVDFPGGMVVVVAMQWDTYLKKCSYREIAANWIVGETVNVSKDTLSI